MEWKTTFHQRINELWERAKDRNHRMTLGAYAQRLETSRGSIRGWLEGKGEPNSEGFVRISNIECVPLDWLLGNQKSTGMETTGTETIFLQKYRAISANGKAILDATLQAIWQQEKRPSHEAVTEKRAISSM